MVLTRASTLSALAALAALVPQVWLPGSSLADKGPGSGSAQTAPAAAAALRGRVRIANVLSSSRTASHTHVSGESDSATEAPETYRRAVVFLESPPDRLDRPSQARERMDQKNERFIPHLLAITTGTVVDFPNGDSIYHNVFSLSKTKRFDLGRYAAGRSKAVRFDRPGIVRVFCEIHSHMNAFILVFDHRYFVVTDEEGRFRMEKLPPGEYKVTAWYEGVSRETRTVVVPASGTADVNFDLK